MWLEEILGLFSMTLEVMLGVAALRFFLAVPLFLVVMALLACLGFSTVLTNVVITEFTVYCCMLSFKNMTTISSRARTWTNVFIKNIAINPIFERLQGTDNPITERRCDSCTLDFAVCEHSTKEINDNRCNSKIDCSNNSIVLSLKSGTSGFNFSGFYFNFSFETRLSLISFVECSQTAK